MIDRWEYKSVSINTSGWVKRGLVVPEEIEALLNEVFTSLDLVTLQTLNADVAVNGLSPSQVASDYLDSLNN